MAFRAQYGMYDYVIGGLCLLLAYNVFNMGGTPGVAQISGSKCPKVLKQAVLSPQKRPIPFPLTTNTAVVTTNVDIVRPLLEMRNFQVSTTPEKSAKFHWINAEESAHLDENPTGAIKLMYKHSTVELTNKAALRNHLELYLRSTYCAYQIDEFYPWIFDMSDRDDCGRFFEVVTASADMNWRLMDDRNKGKMQMYDHAGLTQLRKSLKYDPDTSTCAGAGSMAHMRMQSEVKKQLVIDNRSFEIRMFMLIPSFDPLIAYFREGYVRVFPNSTESFFNHDRYHNRMPLFQAEDNGDIMREDRPETIFSYDQFAQHLGDEVGETRPHTMVRQLTRKMKDIMLLSLLSVKDVVTKNPGAFELLAFDFIVDSQYRPWLAQVDSEARLAIVDSVDKDIKVDLVDEAIDIVFEVSHRKIHGLPLKAASAETYELLLDHTDIPHFAAIESSCTSKTS
eukprot:GFYU01002416.1.p1 GENE.GFYU01002416.1~~GFYU01002416.1.p1  ORF type:complete len:451 (+),score=139.15 GFYU01002416.1:151-1503(+)